MTKRKVPFSRGSSSKFKGQWTRRPYPAKAPNEITRDIDFVWGIFIPVANEKLCKNNPKKDNTTISNVSDKHVDDVIVSIKATIVSIATILK